MPPKFSQPARTDRSATADSTPRGFRTQRGQRPQHTPRGGRSGFSDRRRADDESKKENRTRNIDDAFNATLDSIRVNNLCFVQCILQVLRKQSGVRNEFDHDAALADFWREKGSRHLSYIFRHTNLLHEDGSLSLNEMLSHSETARKIRAMYREGLQSLIQISVAEIPANLRGRNNTVRFLMPLAYVVCDANKYRAMVGFLTTDNSAPGKTPEPDTWFKPADFGDDDARQQQADDLEAHDIASIFIRFENGHSNSISIAHTPFRPDVYRLRYLVNGTNEKNLPSIRRLGLIPGGTRGGRNHVHFALDCLLSSMTDALRPESDCILIARPGAVADLNPVITKSRYVLTPHTVPFNRFCGVWSLIDRARIDIPPDGELSRMNDYNSDIDMSMHIAHHQIYWEKKNENEQDNVTWQRTDYTHYVTDQISDPVIAAHFLNSFKQAKAESARPVRDT